MDSTQAPSHMTIKPLRDCIKSRGSRVVSDYDTTDTGSLFDLIIDCDTKLLGETKDCVLVDALRTIIWFANAALTRRGISPRSRECLGPVPIKATRLLHVIRKADAPYLDLQWLGHHHPNYLPKKWAGVRYLAATARSNQQPSPVENDVFLIEPLDETDPLDVAFDAAERLVNRKDSKADICRKLKLSHVVQVQHRWLCSRTAAQQLKAIEESETALRKEMRSQGIKQLTDKLIEQRILLIRAWKMSGGSTNWQATADAYQLMTGLSITRQGVKDMITRMSEKKIIRLRRGRKKTLKPIIFSEGE